VKLDENGWAIGAVALLPTAAAWTLLSPEPEARVDAARWVHQAKTFFRAHLEIPEPKRYPSGTLPLADQVEVAISRGEGTALTRVLVVTVPMDRAPEAMAAGAAGVRAIGGAGFDALLARTRRVWQVRAEVDEGGDPCAPLAVTAVLASLLLAPVVPPGGGTIFGVKGTRERLTALGWKT
jgi:hypothetical protein